MWAWGASCCLEAPIAFLTQLVNILKHSETPCLPLKPKVFAFDAAKRCFHLKCCWRVCLKNKIMCFVEKIQSSPSVVAPIESSLVNLLREHSHQDREDNVANLQQLLVLGNAAPWSHWLGRTDNRNSSPSDSLFTPKNNVAAPNLCSLGFSVFTSVFKPEAVWAAGEAASYPCFLLSVSLPLFGSLNSPFTFIL